MRTFRLVLALALLTAAAAACGGGEEESPGISPPAEPEATAGPSARATRTPTKPSPSVVGRLEPAGTLEAAPTDAPVQDAPLPTAPPASSNGDPGLVGTWRIYSESLYYDAGGGGVMDSSEVVGTDLGLYSDGSWVFGSSSGSWSVAAIDGSEWDRWLVSPYGPTRKIVLRGWNGGTGDGPLDEETGYVDFVWVIYHVDFPDPGTVYMKFGH